MKHICSLLFCLWIIISLTTACSNPQASENEPQTQIEKTKSNPQTDLKQQVWEQLSENQKKEVIGDWNNATFTKIILKEGPNRINNTNYYGKEVYQVSYPSNKSGILGDFIIFVAIDTGKVIGYGLRD